MKIGIDCRLWNETGVGRYIRNLVAELAEIDKTNDYVLFFRKEPFETYSLPGKNFAKRLADIRWHSVAEQVALKKIFEQEIVDLMHFPYFSFPVGYRGKFVITIHDLIIDHYPTGEASTLPSLFYALKTFGYHYILTQGIKKAQKIIAVSGATKQEIVDHYRPSPEKIVITPEGIDRKLLSEKPQKVDTPEKYFLYVGNVYPHKNVNRLLEAFEQFQKVHTDASLILVGKEDFFSKRLEEKVIKQHIPQVYFYRHISDAQLSYLYSHAVALVAPSLMEGFGLPVIEAMAHGCLVLASEIPAFVEVAGDVCVYFDPYNIEDIAKVLTIAYKKEVKDSAQKKKQGLIKSKSFSWKDMARLTKGVYESCL